MDITKLSSREFNRNVGRAKQAARRGPVIITERGEPAYVLMSHDAYKRMAGSDGSLLELLYFPGADKIDFEPSRPDDSTFQPIDLS